MSSTSTLFHQGPTWWLYRIVHLLLILAFVMPVVGWVSSIQEAALDAAYVHRAEMAKRRGIVEDWKAVNQQEAVDTTSYLNGIDVSHYQGTVQWSKMASQGIDFAMAKATGGRYYTDAQFQNNWNGLRAVNLIRGAYHFYYPADDAKMQLQHYLKTVGPFLAHDLPPILDVEIIDHTNPKALVEGVLIWLKGAEKATGKRPILYTDGGFARQYLSDDRLAKYPLWLADYGKEVSFIPKPWQKQGWQFWQHSDIGYLEGIEGAVDLDRFHGSLSQLKQFIKQSNLRVSNE